MKKVMLIASCVMALLASPVAAQIGSGSGSGSGAGSNGDQAKTTPPSSSGSAEQKESRSTAATRIDETVRFVRALTNVQIEFTLTDQSGSQTPEKKTVSMIASSGSWGKVRSSAQMQQIGDLPYIVVLNVDARPFVSVDGPIQLEMTLVYEPAKGEGDARRPKMSGINQSQTVVLTSGKPLVVSQAADPISDRKVVVEVKATVLK
jgi:hypothetical protein